MIKIVNTTDIRKSPGPSNIPPIIILITMMRSDIATKSITPEKFYNHTLTLFEGLRWFEGLWQATRLYMSSKEQIENKKLNENLYNIIYTYNYRYTLMYVYDVPTLHKRHHRGQADNV